MLRIAYTFQSSNGAHVLWPCWINVFLGNKLILGTVETVSISHSRWTTKAQKCWFGVCEQRVQCPLCEMHLWSYPVALNAQLRNTKEIWNQTLTAPFIMPCYLILKGYFSLIILWSPVEFPQEKIRRLSPFLHMEVRGWGFSDLLMGTSTAQLNFSWAWAWIFLCHHSAFFFLMASYLILKGYFSLIFILLVFYTIEPQTGLDSVIKRKRPSIYLDPQVFYCNENDNKTTSVELFYKPRFHQIFCFNFDLSASSL